MSSAVEMHLVYLAITKLAITDELTIENGSGFVWFLEQQRFRKQRQWDGNARSATP